MLKRCNSLCFQIDVQLIIEMEEEVLQDYLPIRGDRIALTAGRGAATSRPKAETGPKKKGLETSLPRFPTKFTSTQQAHIASKDDCAILVGFSIYEPQGCTRYRQVRSPMGGGIRYPRVLKEATKEELITLIKPLFFPDGKSCHGEVDDFTFDIATDVKGTQLMHMITNQLHWS